MDERPSLERSDEQGRHRPCRTRAAWAAALGFILLLALIVFRTVLAGDILFTTDDNIGALAAAHRALPQSFTGNWQDGQLAGSAGFSTPVSWTPLLVWWLPPEWSMNGMHLLNLVLASLFLLLFLRRRGVTPAVALAGVLTAYWLGSNLTLVYAGHTPKFAVLMFASLALYALERLAEDRTGRLSPWALVSGAAAGFMLLEQQDVGVFFGLLLAAYGGFRLLPCGGEAPRAIPRLLGNYALLAAVTLFMALPHALRVHALSTRSRVEEPAPPDPQAHWAFVTQWSWPPEESLAFIAPGYTGWRTGEPQGPYWGRMGRSPGWEQTGEGLRNFKLENTYLGLLPLLFALLGLVLLRTAPPRRRAETLFWCALALTAYLLALGKFFPLYGLFYRLPMIHDIRNPNKMLMVMQVAWAMAAAFGLQGLLDAGRRRADAVGRTVAPLCRAVYLARLLAILLVTGLAVLLWQEGMTAPRTLRDLAAAGWPPAEAGIITSLRVRALGHAFAMGLAAVAFVFAATSARHASRLHPVLPWLVAVLIAADAVHLSRHYITRLPRHAIETNPVVEEVRDLLGHDRAFLYPGDGFYGLWTTYLFPYQGLGTMNLQQMPRMPLEYARFLQSLETQPFRLWRLMGVRVILLPAALAQGLPGGHLEQSMTFDVAAGEDGQTLRVIPASPGRPGAHGVYRLTVPGARFTLLGGWRQAEGEDAVLRHLADPLEPVLQQVWVGRDPGWPPMAGRGRLGTVEVLERKPSRFLLRVRTGEPAVLRVAEKFDPGWQAWIDDIPVSPVRADYLFQAIHVPAGDHVVRFAFRQPVWPLYTQVGGWLILGAGMGMLLRRRRRHGGAASSAT